MVTVSEMKKEIELLGKFAVVVFPGTRSEFVKDNSVYIFHPVHGRPPVVAESAIWNEINEPTFRSIEREANNGH